MPPEIANLLTEKNLAYATALWVLVTNLGRAYQAWKAEGGARGIWQGLVLGTNAKTETQQIKADTAAAAVEVKSTTPRES